MLRNRDFDIPRKKDKAIPHKNIPVVLADGSVPIQIPVTSPASSQKIGDVSGGNYFEIEQDGTVVYHGEATTWDDSSASAGVFNLGVTGLTLDTLIGGIKQYRFDLNNEPHIPALQLSHSMLVNSIISPHLHIINKSSIAAAPQNIKFEFEWGWVNINSSMPAAVTESVTYDVGGLAALTHKVIGFSDITPIAGQGNISSCFVCRLKRIAADTDPYNTANIFTMGFDLHFRKDTNGSRQESIK